MTDRKQVTVWMPEPAAYIADDVKLPMPLHELAAEIHGLRSKLFGSHDKPQDVSPMTEEAANKIARAVCKHFPISIAGGNAAQLLTDLSKQEQNQLHCLLSNLPNACYRQALHLFPSNRDEHELQQSLRESSVFALLPAALGSRLHELISLNLLTLCMGWYTRPDHGCGDTHPGH